MDSRNDRKIWAGALALWIIAIGAMSGRVSAQTPQAAQPAQATPPPATNAAVAAHSDDLDAIVVTGTSIRGEAPVGSNLVTVDRQQIDQTSAQTVQQILRTVPSITGSGATPQGGNPGNSFYAPTIHGIGSSSSNATLVLVDGHRISPGSQQQQLTDPNIIPPIALERVEVLAARTPWRASSISSRARISRAFSAPRKPGGVLITRPATPVHCGARNGQRVL
jgi:outer membrane receptor protein involved in Fe transport